MNGELSTVRNSSLICHPHAALWVMTSTRAEYSKQEKAGGPRARETDPSSHSSGKNVYFSASEGLSDPFWNIYCRLYCSSKKKKIPVREIIYLENKEYQ